MQYDVHPNQIRVSKAHLVAAATGLFGSGDAASDASVIAPDRQVANDKAFASCMVEGLSDLFWRRSTARAEQRRLGQGGAAAASGRPLSSRATSGSGYRP
jgi:hypothetical protein